MLGTSIFSWAKHISDLWPRMELYDWNRRYDGNLILWEDLPEIKEKRISFGCIRGRELRFWQFSGALATSLEILISEQLVNVTGMNSQIYFIHRFKCFALSVSWLSISSKWSASFLSRKIFDSVGKITFFITCATTLSTRSKKTGSRS